MKKLTVLLGAAAFAAYLTSCQGTAEKGAAAGGSLDVQEQKLVDDYKVLADEILKVRKSGGEASKEQKQKELDIVKGLLTIYHEQADQALAAAKTAQGAAQADALKSAITAVGKIAQEGDTRVDGIKKDLQKGGHHHSKAEDSDEEYIYVNSKAKKALMAENEKLRKLLAGGGAVPAAEIDGIMKNVCAVTDEALKAKK